MTWNWRRAGCGLGLCLWASTAQAQFDRRWVEFRNETATRLVAAPALGSSDPKDKDFAWGDLDHDGDIDLVVVRRPPGTVAGGDPGVLFMNEGGVLVDRTALYATDSDVPGDQGLQTPANNRDVVLADFDGDGWLDMATAVTISDGLPKEISHPRIYMNKGAIGGVWQGLRFEAGRSPQLYVLNLDGTPDLTKPQPGRFCAIAAGDIDMDGDVDLYLGDYDSSGVATSGGATEPPGVDLNDRLWLNDGNGFFTDSYQTVLNAQMLNSAFNVSDDILDINGDGLNDLIKDTGLTAPLQYVGIAYNFAPNDAVFDLFHVAQTLSPYFVSVGDLNNDSKLDMVVTDDNRDRYRLNQGNDALNRVNWGTIRQVSYPSGAGYSDDGFGGQSLIADLDRDGFKDVLITDMDVDTPPTAPDCGRRMHVYHNLGNVPDVSLFEEAQQAQPTLGWKGAVGLKYSDLNGTHNVAAFDLDRDGDDDLVLGRCAGTSVWINDTCRLKISGTSLPNSTGLPARLTWTGTAARANNDLVLEVSQLPPLAEGRFVVAQNKAHCVQDGGGLRCIDPLGRLREWPATADSQGHVSLTIDFNDPLHAELVAGAVRYVQFRYDDAATPTLRRRKLRGSTPHNWSDTLDLKVCP